VLAPRPLPTPRGGARGQQHAAARSDAVPQYEWGEKTHRIIVCCILLNAFVSLFWCLRRARRKKARLCC